MDHLNQEDLKDWVLRGKPKTQRNKSFASFASTAKRSRHSSMSSTSHFNEWNAKKHSRINSLQLKEKMKVKESMREKPKIDPFSQQLANKKLIDEMNDLAMMKHDIKTSKLISKRNTRNSYAGTYPVKVTVDIKNSKVRFDTDQFANTGEIDTQKSTVIKEEFSSRLKNSEASKENRKPTRYVSLSPANTQVAYAYGSNIERIKKNGGPLLSYKLML